MMPAPEWPPAARSFRSNPPEGAVGIVLPIRDDLAFFKLCFHSILSFTDYRYMLTVVDNMSGFSTRQYLESLRRNHPINVLQYHKDASLAAMWDLGLRFMFSFSTVRYGVAMTPTVVVEPHWLSGLVNALEGDKCEAVAPNSNAMTRPCVLFSREAFERGGAISELPAGVAERVYVHKFKRNGFDPRSQEPITVPAPEKEEASR